MLLVDNNTSSQALFRVAVPAVPGGIQECVIQRSHRKPLVVPLTAGMMEEMHGGSWFTVLSSIIVIILSCRLWRKYCVPVGDYRDDNLFNFSPCALCDRLVRIL